MSRYKGDTDLLNIIQVYKLVLAGKIGRFPNYTWSESDKYENATQCARYMIEEILNWDDEKIKEELSIKVFVENKLGGMLHSVFVSSPYKILNLVYPGKFKPWEMAMSPSNTWDMETSIEAFKWLVEEKLEWDDEDIKEKLSLKVLRDNKLGGMMKLHRNSPFAVLDSAYPGRFKMWELTSVPADTWNEETGGEAFRWLIEEKLKWDKEEMKKNLNRGIVVESGFEGLLQTSPFDGSLLKLFKVSYPNINPQEIRSFRYFENDNKEFARKKIKEVIEEKTKGKIEEIRKIGYDFFRDNDIATLVQLHYNNSPYMVVNELYPGILKPWEMGGCSPRNLWDDEELIKEAVRWLVEEELKIEPRLSFLVLRRRTLDAYRLGGILKKMTMLEALELVYPNKKPYSIIEIYELVLTRKIKKYPNGFWEENSEEKAIKILKYLIEEKLEMNEEDVYKDYNDLFTRRYRLKIALEFTGLTFQELLNVAYPDKYKPWRFFNVPTAYYTKENIIRLVETELKEANIKKKDWKRTVDTQWLKDNKLVKLFNYISVTEIRERIA